MACEVETAELKAALKAWQVADEAMADASIAYAKAWETVQNNTELGAVAGLMAALVAAFTVGPGAVLAFIATLMGWELAALIPLRDAAKAYLEAERNVKAGYPRWKKANDRYVACTQNLWGPGKPR